MHSTITRIASTRLLLGLLGCSTVYVVDTTQIDTAKALLQYCTEVQRAYVGVTNDSLARAYLHNTEGLEICKSVSRAIQDLED